MSGGWPAVGLAADRTEATVYLPDPAVGYYRGPRFDWSGLMASLRLDGHEVVGEWKTAPHDPLGNDFVVGPACELGMGPETGNPSPPGYEETPPGGTFLKIGVGELVKPDERPYHFGTAYEVARIAPWRVRWGPSWMEASQEAAVATGWGYRYAKRIELARGEPTVSIRYALANTGRRGFRQTWYCHNFIRLDGRAVGRGYRLDFPFTPRLARSVGEVVEARGRSLVYTRDLGPDEGMFAAIEGFGASAADNEVIIRWAAASDAAPSGSAAGIGLRIRGSLPVARLHLFATGRTICPELFVDLDLAPGRSISWTDRYSLVGAA